jgi:hypothetical protein
MLFAGVAGAQAHAQEAIIAKVPFDFVVNGQTFHSGRYEIRTGEAAPSPEIVSVRGLDGSVFKLVMASPATGHDPAGTQPALVFTRNEKTYVLSQVWTSAASGREIPKS